MSRWTFWILGWDHGPTYKKVKDTNQHWPVSLHENLAKQRGFTRLVVDQTIIGGYFVEPSSGDALICIPSDMRPEDY